MKSKNKIFFTIAFLLIILLLVIFIKPFFVASEKNLENKVAELVVTSNDLIHNYVNNEEESNKLYTGKIIEVTGFIKKITFLNDRNTIILNSENETFGVICDINSNQKEKIKALKLHQKIRVKGICKGFLKDVILLNCSIDLLTNE